MFTLFPAQLEDAATGLGYLHKRGIAHGDLGGVRPLPANVSVPSQDLQYNILITSEIPPRACVADYGLSAVTPGVPREAATITTGDAPTHVAPELREPGAQPTQSGDIYAFGVVIYEVLTGFRTPCDGRCPPDEPAYHEQIWFGCGTWELTEECRDQESTRRPNIERVLSHLTRVATTSAVVGPTPGRAHEGTDDSPGPVFSTERSTSPCRDPPRKFATPTPGGPRERPESLPLPGFFEKRFTLPYYDPRGRSGLAGRFEDVFKLPQHDLTSRPGSAGEDPPREFTGPTPEGPRDIYSHPNGSHFPSLVYRVSQLNFRNSSRTANDEHF